ncbi:MAG: hydantoinase/oxoprolinase family protein [Acidimicrobiales bacterium]
MTAPLGQAVEGQAGRGSHDWRLAVDIGGTFTDLVLLDRVSGQVAVDKVLTTPAAPLEGVQAGVVSLLARAGVEPTEIVAPIVHATTLITNALIENKTARTALVTTSGFGDTLEIRTEHRYDMYDLQIEFPAPPVPRHLVFELDERTLATGEVRDRPSDAALDQLAARLGESHVVAVAVALLHSYANPANERLVAARLADRLGDGVAICTSSEVAPQIREYPRLVTTACNAATMPVLGPYLAALTTWLEATGFGGEVLMMLSNGGVVSAADATRTPIRLVESGPAAGALAGSWYAERLREPRLLCFDMGGTTAKSCLIEGTEPELTNTFEVARVYRFKKGSGFPMTVPSVDLVEIGAGGGSIARVDDMGLLKVGPDSAGAEPGPACYGRGGTSPTVTDADLLLGFLDADNFLGGDLPLDRRAAEDAIGKLARDLGLSITDTAAGIHELVNHTMAAAARMHAVERGTDLRGVPVIAFGGAGPVHACGVAELLEADRVVFPVNASVLSAFGTLVSPVRIDLARSLPRGATDDPAARELLLADLRAEGGRVLEGAGVAGEDVSFRLGVDARYVGQGNEVTVWLDADGDPGDDDALVRAFTAEYQRIYGLAIPDVPVEVVTWRVSAVAAAAELTHSLTAVGGSPTVSGQRVAGDRHHPRRPARFSRDSDAVEVPVVPRRDLRPGDRLAGPALVEERETTAVLRPGWDATVLPDGAIVAVDAHRATAAATTADAEAVADANGATTAAATTADATGAGSAT